MLSAHQTQEMRMMKYGLVLVLDQTFTRRCCNFITVSFAVILEDMIGKIFHVTLHVIKF